MKRRDFIKATGAALAAVAVPVAALAEEIPSYIYEVEDTVEMGEMMGYFGEAQDFGFPKIDYGKNLYVFDESCWLKVA